MSRAGNARGGSTVDRGIKCTGNFKSARRRCSRADLVLHVVAPSLMETLSEELPGAGGVRLAQDYSLEAPLAGNVYDRVRKTQNRVGRSNGKAIFNAPNH